MGKLLLTWQYNGVAPWSEIIDWCMIYIDTFNAQSETIFFYNDTDYTLFMLRWA